MDADQHTNQIKKVFDLENITALPVIRFETAVTSNGVADGSMRETNAGLDRGASDSVTHLRPVCIRLTVGIQVQIIKFTNSRVASLQHLYV